MKFIYSGKLNKITSNNTGKVKNIKPKLLKDDLRILYQFYYEVGFNILYVNNKFAEIGKGLGKFNNGNIDFVEIKRVKYLGEVLKDKVINDNNDIIEETIEIHLKSKKISKNKIKIEKNKKEEIIKNYNQASDLGNKDNININKLKNLEYKKIEITNKIEYYNNLLIKIKNIQNIQNINFNEYKILFKDIYTINPIITYNFINFQFNKILPNEIYYWYFYYYYKILRENKELSCDFNFKLKIINIKENNEIKYIKKILSLIILFKSNEIKNYYEQIFKHFWKTKLDTKYFILFFSHDTIEYFDMYYLYFYYIFKEINDKESFNNEEIKYLNNNIDIINNNGKEYIIEYCENLYPIICFYLKNIDKNFNYFLKLTPDVLKDDLKGVTNE